MENIKVKNVSLVKWMVIGRMLRGAAEYVLRERRRKGRPQTMLFDEKSEEI